MPWKRNLTYLNFFNSFKLNLLNLNHEVDGMGSYCVYSLLLKKESGTVAVSGEFCEFFWENHFYTFGLLLLHTDQSILPRFVSLSEKKGLTNLED